MSSNSGTHLINQLERALAVRGLQMKIKFEVEHSYTLAALAGAGLGLGILPKVALPRPVRKTMQALPIVNPTLERTVCIVSLRGQSFSPAASALTSVVHKFLKPRP